MRPLRVAMTGSSGFIGSAVLSGLLRARTSGRIAELRLLGRTPPDRHTLSRPGLVWQHADLAEPRSLAGTLDGTDVLVHLAARTSGTVDECETVNTRACEVLAAEARRVGLGRIVHLSTAAVYGAGPHSGIAVDEIPPAPVSAASATRLAGERFMLAAGGTVLRPGLVLGLGDRWVVPALDELITRVPAHWDGGRGLLSVVDVHDLARLVVTVATAERPLPGVHHASHPRPVSNADLMAALTALGVLPEVTESWPWEKCVRQLHANPGRVSERQFALLARDHWYRSEEIWRVTGCPAGPGPVHRLPAAAEWYTSHLGAQGSRTPR